ncbi:MAG: copper chaperone PCu(A)C [Rhodocyclaceae bacterium]|nr:copper chaperone PCu(A)C [Rhodocyclaceae bacterium]
MPIRYLVIRLLGVALLLGASQAGAGSLEISEAYVREMPPVARNTAAFMTVLNTGDVLFTIVGARSAAAASAELHDHLRDGEVMRMRPVAAVPVPPHDRVRFEPGGLHVMLMDLVAPLVAGQVVEIELLLANGTRLPVSFPVRSLTDGPAASTGHGMHEVGKH